MERIAERGILAEIDSLKIDERAREHRQSPANWQYVGGESSFIAIHSS